MGRFHPSCEGINGINRDEGVMEYRPLQSVRTGSIINLHVRHLQMR